MSWPTEIVAKAEYEIGIFERTSADTSLELIAEVKKLRAMLCSLADATDTLAAEPTPVNREDAQALVHDARAML